MKIHSQKDPYESPWTTGQRVKLLLWEYAWRLLCSWTPKPANRWRIFWLRIFGCQIYGRPFVHPLARIQIPWNLILHDRACLGSRANAYSLGKIEIFEEATIAQEAYLCTGSHALDQVAKNLITAPIIVGAHAFIGARAFILPGVTIGEHAMVGACSVVTKSVPAGALVKGNPAKQAHLHSSPRELLGNEK
ncbi:DapH/DapD/GlmU-related protein [Nafulsella turpanensis]|uniref:DapH/DapD/GlmU-related protein n=1 Tax=Nafulsella turpanensis TaxID=1265690 RepID=UPI00036FBE93|nr:DapH/DapD/GlmU-related protein [Nafulsella turpanensis]